MYKITDITLLGTEYTVSSPEGKVLGAIQVIPFADIMSATLGPYTDVFVTYENYMKKSVALLSGFEKIDQDSIYWYTTTEDEIKLSEIFEFAIDNDYSTIILEHLEELDE